MHCFGFSKGKTRPRCERASGRVGHARCQEQNINAHQVTCDVKNRPLRRYFSGLAAVGYSLLLYSLLLTEGQDWGHGTTRVKARETLAHGLGESSGCDGVVAYLVRGSGLGFFAPRGPLPTQEETHTNSL